MFLLRSQTSSFKDKFYFPTNQLPQFLLKYSILLQLHDEIYQLKSSKNRFP